MTSILIVQGQFWHMYGNVPPSKSSIHGCHKQYVNTSCALCKGLKGLRGYISHKVIIVCDKNYKNVGHVNTETVYVT